MSDNEEFSLTDMGTAIAPSKPVKKTVEIPESIKVALEKFNAFSDNVARESNIASTDAVTYNINKNTVAIMISMLEHTLNKFYNYTNPATTSAVLSIINSLNQSLEKMKATENNKDLPDKLMGLVSTWFEDTLVTLTNDFCEKLSDLVEHGDITTESAGKIKEIFIVLGDTADSRLSELKSKFYSHFSV